MALLQGANYILPLLTIPYIARVISPDNFGLVSYAQAFVAYTTVLINFGFDYTITREIAANRNNGPLISTIVSKTIVAKFAIFSLCTLVYIPLIYTIPKFSQNIDLYIYTFLVNIGIVLMPSWLFQGMEKLNYLAIFNFVIKVIFTILIFSLVKEDRDYIFIPLSTAIGQIVIGAISFYWAIKSFNLKPYFAKLKDVLGALKEGLPIFASTVAVTLYTTTNLVVLGFMESDATVGFYAASSKLVIIFISAVMVPVGLTLFPYIGKKLNESFSDGMNAIRRATLLTGGITLVISIALFFTAEYIIMIIYGPQFKEAASSLKVLSFLPFIIGLNNIFGTQGLLNLKSDKAFLIVTTIGAVGSITLNFTLVPLLAEKGTAIAWIITEAFITIAFFIILHKKGFRLFKKLI